MKKIFTVLLFTSIVFAVKAQVNLSWPDSNATWVNTYYHVSSPNPSLQRVDYYCMETSDTLINSVKYTQISDCLNGYRGAMRDANGKVFYVPKDSAQEYLVYDFTAKVGDTIRDVYMEYGWGGTGLDNVWVTFVDSVFYEDLWRKRIYLGSKYWIEGIGNSQGLLRDPFANISNFWIDLHCFSINDSSIYPNSGYGPCNLISNGQNAPDVDVYVSVKDTNGNPLKSYKAYLGRGTDLSVQYPNSLFTNSKGIGHKVISAAPTNSVFAYVFDCNGDTIVDFKSAIPKTANDSVLFEFVMECPGDTCGIVLRHELVDKDSNYYQLYYGETGIGGIRSITPTWTFSDSIFILDNEPIKQFRPGWTTYCINYGCDTATCDSLYVMPDCTARFFTDTTGGNLTYWQSYRVSPSSYNFSWDFGDGNTSNSPFPNHTYAQPGSYAVCLTVNYADDSTTCTDTYCENVFISGANQNIQVKDSATIGMDEISELNFEVYPNPASNLINIKGESLRKVELVEIYSASGKLMLTKETSKEDRIRLALDNLKSGVYFLRLTSPGFSQCQRLQIH